MNVKKPESSEPERSRLSYRDHIVRNKKKLQIKKMSLYCQNAVELLIKPPKND